jgi:hypothetical protein
MPGTVAGLVTKFERQRFDRVVMSGHGIYFAADRKVKVPAGVKIHFYVKHGHGTKNSVGMAVENKFASKAPPQPLETFTEGQEVYNYRLGFGSELELGGNLSTYKYDWITVNQPDRLVPLNVLFKDPRCKGPCEIHWAACRSTADANDQPSDYGDSAAEVTLTDSSGASYTHKAVKPGAVKIPKGVQALRVRPP